VRRFEDRPRLFKGSENRREFVPASSIVRSQEFNKRRQSLVHSLERIHSLG
jgi:hypothetical protein